MWGGGGLVAVSGGENDQRGGGPCSERSPLTSHFIHTYSVLFLTIPSLYCIYIVSMAIQCICILTLRIDYCDERLVY